MNPETSSNHGRDVMDRAEVTAAVDALFAYLGNMLYSPEEAKLDLEALPEAFREFGKGLLFFTHMLTEFRKFASELGKGNLSVAPPSAENELASPLKSLHASLRHLTWQSQQVAQGDYKQKVDFMGEFAEAFNAMTRQLEEQRASLLDEIESGRRKTLALEKNISLFKTITERIDQWIIVVDRATGGALFSNNMARTTLEKNLVIADRLREWLAKVAAKEEGEEKDTETLQLAADDKLWYFSIAKYRLAWLAHDAVVFVITDMSEEHKYIQELESVAYQDALTHVNSRHYGMRTLHDWVDSHLEFCLCFIDLDSLKYVNDTFGHQAGDEYITTVAKMLSDFSSDVVVARLGGDEFMLLQQGWTEEKASEKLAAIREELGRQDTGPEYIYTRSISYGVVHVGMYNATPASDILSLADEIMYRFKREHKKERKPSGETTKRIKPDTQAVAGPETAAADPDAMASPRPAAITRTVVQANARMLSRPTTTIREVVNANAWAPPRPASPEADQPLKVLAFLTEHLAGMRTQTTIGNARIDCPGIWEDFLASKMRFFPDSHEPRSYGVSFITDLLKGTFDYWAALPLAGGLPIPAGLTRLEIPAGLYALHPAKTNTDFTDIYDYLYGPWLSSRKDYRLDLTRPSFELYLGDFHDAGDLVIHIPVLAVG